MNLRPSQLQIEGYYVKELHCVVHSGLDETTPLALVAGLHVQHPEVVTVSPFLFDVQLEGGKHKENPNRFRFSLHVASKASPTEHPPYDFKLLLVGYFGLDSPLLADPFLEQQVGRNAAMLLYSAAREILASVTSRGPFPALVLPAYTFHLDGGETKELKPASPKALKPKPKKAARSRSKKR